MSTLTLEPKTDHETDRESGYLEFELPTHDLTVDSDVASERDRYDDQIIAALVCP